MMSLLAVVLCAAVAAQDVAPTLPIASDGQNVWVVSQRMGKKGREHVLMHHGTAMNGPYVSTVLAFDNPPGAMAAAHGTVWMVIPAVDAVRARAEVHSITAQFIPATGLTQYEPRDSTKLLGALPEGCSPAGAATDGDDLIVGCQAGVPVRQVPKGWLPCDGAPPARQVLQWGRKPAGVVAVAPFTVAVEGPNHWPTTALNVPANSTVAAVPGVGRPTVIVTDAAGTSRLAYVIGNELAQIAELPHSTMPWGVAAVEDGFLHVVATADGSLTLRHIDGVDGRLGEPELATFPPSPVGQWIHLLIIGMLLVAVALMAGLIHQVGPQGRSPAPYGYSPLPLPRRLVALAIDLAPGAATVVLLGYPPKSLTALPMLTTTAAAVPGMLWVLFTLGFCVVLEILFGTTLGKRLASGRVARMVPPGQRPLLWQVLVRNVFKGMLLLVPPAALLMMWAPGGRGVGDVLAGTAVIRRQVPQPLKPE